MSNETNRMMDLCENIKEQIDDIKSRLLDLVLSLEPLGKDVWEKYPEQENIWDSIQFCISCTNKTINELNRAKRFFDEAYDDIHYNEFEAMKE